MEKLIPALDLDALRSFVAGIEGGSFAQAAMQLSRSTSAVSAQLKKLEMLCDANLVVKNGRHLELTHHGEMLMSYARRMLELNDEALRAIKGEMLTGEMRIGMQEDFGESLMPGILSQFKRHHPGLRILAKIDRNQALQTALDSHQLDMALMWQSDTQSLGGKALGACQLEWIYHPEFDISGLLERGEPLPLVMFEHPCLMRHRATTALDRAGIPWRVMFVSHSLNGIWAAIQAGLGVTVRTHIGLPENLRKETQLLPPLGKLGITLERLITPASNHIAQTRLTQLIEQALSAFTR